MIWALLSCLFCITLFSQPSYTQKCTTTKGNACIFPFEYKDETYNNCSTEKVKPGRSWCSLSVDENGIHQKGRRGVTWGLCSDDCQVHGDQVCAEGSQCMYRDNCTKFQEFKKLPRSHPDYRSQRSKWRSSVCNKKEKRLCCSTVDPSCNARPQYPGSYLPQLNIDRCGKACITQSRVSGGVNVKLGEFPWAALLGYKVKKKVWDYQCQCQKTVVKTKYRCGGTLINNRYVLTAAHCHEGNNKISSVVLGEWEVGVDPDCPPEGKCLPLKQAMEVESVTIHENYFQNKKIGEVLNDIALIRLKQPVVFNEAVQPICLPLNQEQTAEDIEADNLFDGIVGRNVAVIGWGANGSFQAQLPKDVVSQQILQKIEIPINSNEDCKSRLLDLNQENVDNIITDTHVCAGQEGSDKDSCKGDSGGGMFIKEITGEDSRYHQVGLVSFGLSRLCGIGFSGVYTRITEFIPWIRENIHD